MPCQHIRNVRGGGVQLPSYTAVHWDLDPKKSDLKIRLASKGKWAQIPLVFIGIRLVTRAPNGAPGTKKMVTRAPNGAPGTKNGDAGTKWWQGATKMVPGSAKMVTGAPKMVPGSAKMVTRAPKLNLYKYHYGKSFTFILLFCYFTFPNVC